MFLPRKLLIRAFSSSAKGFGQAAVTGSKQMAGVHTNNKQEIFGSGKPLKMLEEEARSILNQAIEASAKRRYEESNSFLDKALDIFQNTFGEEYPELYNIFLTKGQNYAQMKDYKAADQCFSKAKELTSKFNSNSFEVLKLYTDLAWLHTLREEFGKAEECYMKCVDMIHQGKD